MATLHLILLQLYAMSFAIPILFLGYSCITSEFHTLPRRVLMPSSLLCQVCLDLHVLLVPGLPVIGNLLQLKEKKPYKTFTRWAEEYGPIYSIKTGASTMVVLNASRVAKEAMVTRYSSISNRKLSNALRILTADKCLVSLSDYDDFHKMIKQYILSNFLGPTAQEIMCYIDFLLSEGKTLTRDQISMLLWETVIATADTTMITTEWAMYEIAKDPKRQDRLYQEIQKVCGSETVTEEHLSQLPYLNAVFHEIQRKHSPVSLVPLRVAHEDTQLGGYYIPAGTEIAINIYGCNMNKHGWESPEEWKPERFLDPKNDVTNFNKTMAFGDGKRVCPGSLQAMLIACSTIGMLVQEFEWKLRSGEDENVDTVGFTTHKLYPMEAILKPRS